MTRKNILMATVALLMANFMGGLDSTIVNTALPAIMSDLDGMRLVGWISSAFLLGSAVTTILWGRIGEMIGNKRAFQASVLLFIISSLLGGISSNMIMLIVSRGLMGIGTGGMVSIPFIIYVDLYPNSSDRAKALGWVTAFYAFSTVIGPLIGGWIVDQLSWHWVFLINLPIGIISLIILQFNYHQAKIDYRKASFDYLGAGVLAVALTVLLFGMDSLAGNLGMAALLIVIALGLLVIFWQIEKRVNQPLIPNKLLKIWPVQSQNVIMFLIYGFFIGYSVYAPMWAQGLMGTSATLGGLTQIAGSVLLLIGTRVTAQLMTKLSYRLIVTIGFGSLLISALMLVFATQNVQYWVLFVSGGFEGLGMGLAFTPMQVAIQDDVDPELIGISTTFSLLFRTLGQTFLAAIYGAVLSRSTSFGIENSHGKITNKMMNQLTNPKSATTLNADLISEMKTILFNGIHLIMVIGVILLLTGLIINLTRPMIKSIHK